MKLFRRRVRHATYSELFDKYVSSKSELSAARGLFALLVHHLTNGDGEITFAYDTTGVPPSLAIFVNESKDGKITIAMRRSTGTDQHIETYPQTED